MHWFTVGRKGKTQDELPSETPASTAAEPEEQGKKTTERKQRNISNTL